MRLPSLLVLAALLAADHAWSPWQGEWAQLDPRASTVGSRLTLFGCTGQSCQFRLAVNTGCGTSFSDDAPRLPLLSSTDATVTLPAGDSGKSCTLTLRRDPAGARITVTSTGAGCGYYCTSTPSFNATLPFQSPTAYVGLHQDACLLHTSPAASATCRDPALAQLEQQWLDLFNDDPLDHPNAPGDSAYSHAQAVDTAILKTCDADPNPAPCLKARFTADIAAMGARKQAVEEASTARGDPALGHALAVKIAGRYRQRFANGDVQGDHFTSTDRMTLTPVGKASIRFDIELNFYNGHTCSVSGGALYRKDGSFVFDDDPANAAPGEPACRLALMPTSKGVEIKDLGGCKMSYCGMRGGFNGAGFSFANRRP